MKDKDSSSSSATTAASSSSGTEEKRKKKEKHTADDSQQHSKSARPAVPALPPDEPAVNKHLASLQMPSKKGGSLPLMKQRSESTLLDGSSSPADGTDEPAPANAISLATYAGELSLRDQLVRELFTSECKYVEGLMMLQHQVTTTTLLFQFQIY